MRLRCGANLSENFRMSVEYEVIEAEMRNISLKVHTTDSGTGLMFPPRHLKVASSVKVPEIMPVYV